LLIDLPHVHAQIVIPLLRQYCPQKRWLPFFCDRFATIEIQRDFKKLPLGRKPDCDKLTIANRFPTAAIQTKKMIPAANGNPLTESPILNYRKKRNGALVKIESFFKIGKMRKDYLSLSASTFVRITHVSLIHQKDLILEYPYKSGFDPSCCYKPVNSCREGIKTSSLADGFGTIQTNR